MKKLFVLSLVLLMASCQSQPQAPEKPQVFNYSPDFKALAIDEARLGRIDALLNEYVDGGILPHALTFVAKNGQVIHNKAYGWRDLESKDPIQMDNIFRMYSQTKAIATTALMTLFEQGKFQMDDPVSKYIPEMTDQVLVEYTNEDRYTTRPAASPVLIRHIVSHASGINGFRRVPGSQTPAPAFDTLADYVKYLVSAPLAFDPGTNYNYHPASDVMGYLVEIFSGKPLQEYLEEAIFEPLGITDMAYYYDESYRDRFVSIYRENEGKLEKSGAWSGRDPFGDDRRYASAGTGLNGTIEGYARFCQMIANNGIFNGHRVLGRRTIEMMSRNILSHPHNGGANFDFGTGFQIYPEESKDWNFVNGFSPMVSPGALSWGGAANTDYIIDHKEDMIILLYTNRMPDTLVWEKFLNTVYQTLE